MKKIYLILLMLLPAGLLAQTRYTLVDNTFTVNGTSTLHDWTMESKKGAGVATFTVEDNQITDVKSTQIRVPSESLKSNKSSMDKVAYDALQTKDHKVISFVLKKATLKEKGIYNVTGDLTIAGTTKSVTFPVKGKVSNDDIFFDGDVNLKMTDFNLTPPVALMGTVKTGDQIKILIKLQFRTNNNS
jgi:polyisoprenoid-binding protein YceI